MQRPQRLLIALFLAVGTPALAQLSVVAEPAHLTVARQLLAQLDLANTNYEHGAPRVKFTNPCASHADCSGFADALLEHVYGFDKQQFRAIFGSGRPTAARYHDAIRAQNGFKLMDRVQDILPGDFLAVKYLNRNDNTGHVMLVAERPRRIRPTQPLIEQTEQWEARVIDSSESGHGPSDTRHGKGADGKDHDGLGQGTLRLYTDSQGQIAGFTWSTLAKSQFRSPTEEEMVIGRLEAKFGR